jgi:porin
MKIKTNSLVLFVAFLLINPFVEAQESEEEPVLIESAYVGDFLVNFSGGIKTGREYMGLIDFAVQLNTNALKLWPGGKFYVQVENTHGNSASARLIGDLQVVSNIDNGDYTYLYMAWYEQTLGRMDVTMGVHDLNSEFHISDYAGAYINSSFGIMPSASLNIPVPIFPKNALGLILKYDFSDALTFQTAVYDGDPGSLDDDPHNLDLTIDVKNQGILSISEFHYKNEHTEGIYKIGFQYHTAKFMDFRDSSDRQGDFGIYTIIDQPVLANAGVFLQLGIAPKSYNLNPLYIGSGINFQDIMKEGDVLGVAFACATISDVLQDMKSNETVFEFTYHFPVTDNISVQPDIQYIINPGAVPGYDNAFVGLIRLCIEN